MEEFTPQISSLLDQIIRSIPVFKPELGLIIAFLCCIFSSLFLDRYWRNSTFSIACLGIVGTAYAVYSQLGQPQSGFFGMLQVDTLAVYGRLIMLVLLLPILVLIREYANDKGLKNEGDIYSILLAATLGMNLLTLSTNWLMVFIAIETVSISSYVLVGYFTNENKPVLSGKDETQTTASINKKQSEATMKYVLFGSVCAAVMLYGLSLIYGFTGNLDFSSSSHIQGLISAPKIMSSVAILFVFVGNGFKLGFVPFHLWTPDVYEGAPTPITTFLATVPKIAALILFQRLFESWTSTLFYFSELTLLFITVVAIVTMLMGNLIALRQSDAKRLMAYSSIGHTGFLLMAIISSPSSDYKTLLFYITVYAIMTIGAFAIIQFLEKYIGSTALVDYSGLGKHKPLLFTTFTLLGISLIGLPPTAGFIGKLLVFTSTFDRYQNTQDVALLLLLITGALTSVISLFYYFKIPLYAFLRKEESLPPTYTTRLWPYLIAIVCGITILLFGLFPHLLSGLFV
ncbi:NADH-quinone oxidoreductase subunit N [Sphingobacterium paucimobilis]|uniref:NADH-quinone oxidoreductase subunit N n=1 Tax=Sphingobacterium paucimobilis HER1398 TaxID=1346330 RepID=U2J6V8_9SPHI|nr:NADH-quinone oxidoreductase subunit N [Sphingobacterium paucimobilis]ERJ60644.1 hypothetical protein M472_17955 [Sphingobacterium paucimobilis HER1398]